MTRSVEDAIESRIWTAENGKDAHLLPIDMLEPYTKILNDSHYYTIIESIELRGLLNPFVILQIDEDEWHKQFVRDDTGSIIGPATFGPPIRYRVQCGNHRYYALRHYFNAELVPCEVYDDPEEAAKACKKYRRSKEWKKLESPTLL